MKVGKTEIAPRELTAHLMCEKMAGNNHADVTIMRVEAHEKPPSGLRARFGMDRREPRVLSFTMVDRFDSKTGLTSMMRTTAWPAAIVVQMLASGEIAKRGGIHQELDIPAQAFLDAMSARGIGIDYSER